MTAVANPPLYTQRPPWYTGELPVGMSSVNPDEVSRMFMPRKSAQRANSSSSISSSTSSSSSSGSSTSTETITSPLLPSSASSMNGGLGPCWTSGNITSGTGSRPKKAQRTGPWPTSKSEAIAGVTTTRPQSILATNGNSAAASMSIHQPNGVVSSQQVQSTTQQNGARPGAAGGEGNPLLYLLSMNGTFERKTISVPYYPEVLRIGRQTNAKTVPTPLNGFFDSKVLSRQHAEVWADRQGKVWIRDVRSSNGTFVNGTRLSAENRDSEPHELQSQDHLELGIDIVSEDQKTVVHHKVAAKVEHAGYLGPTTNVLDMSFGDLDPANGSMMLPSQNGNLRGRTNSQGSVGGNGRAGPPGSVAGSNMLAGQQRPMNFWLTPVTTEQIVKRLTTEIREARRQNQDLERTGVFFNHLLSGEELRSLDKPKSPEPLKPIFTNGGSLSLKKDGISRFSDPPAPPPQQPLPEKPDGSRYSPSDPSSPLLKRTYTERPRSIPSISPGPSLSPVKPALDMQMTTLLEALQQAKKEIDAQNTKVKDLEELLQREREARETAEGLAKRLELESGEQVDVSVKSHERSEVEEAFDPPTVPATNESAITEAVEAVTTQFQERLDSMLFEMREMKQKMEQYRQRAETAEKERDEDRQTLAEMVLKIRSGDRRRSRSPTKSVDQVDSATDIEDEVSSKSHTALGPTVGGPTADELSNQLASALRPPAQQGQFLQQSTPYASMLGVVLLGMGLMAYINGGFQKVER